MTSVIFTFARMQPPTIGHEKLVNLVVDLARAKDCDQVVFLSQSNNPKTDPLDWKFKQKVCKSAFKEAYISDDEAIKNPFLALELLSKEYDDITIVVGADRVDKMQSSLAKQAQRFNVKFNTVSAGERNEKSRGVAGISASKMRTYAESGNKEKFILGLPRALTPRIKDIVYKKTIKGLSIK